jgi:chromosome segregation protein
MIIAQIRAENIELEQRENEFAVLNSQIHDLEHKFRLLQNEKNRTEVEARNKEAAQLNQHESLKGEIQRMNLLLYDAEQELRDRLSELSAQKALIENRNVDITRLRKLVADMEDESICIHRARSDLQQELEAAHNARRLAEQGATRRAEDGEVIRRAREAEESRLRNAIAEAEKLSRRLVDLQATVDSIESQSAQKDEEAMAISQMKRQTQDEVDSLTLKNSRLQEEKQALLNKIKDLEAQSRLADRKLEDITVLIDAKEKELKTMRSSSAYVESKEAASRQDLRKLQTENENLQVLLDKYRDDAQLHKQLRDKEAQMKYQLEEEKNRLSREALVKSLEAQTAKKELKRYQGSHDQLLQERAMVSQELEAIKEHANLLESQNMTVTLHLTNS